MEGGIYLPQAVLEQFMYSSPNTLRMLIHLLLQADPVTGKVEFSLRKISADTGLSVKCARTALSKLQETHLVAQVRAHPTMVIMICDIASYKLKKITEGTVEGKRGAQLKETEIEKETEKEKEKEKIPPHTPLLKEKEKEKEKEKDRDKENSSSPRARTHERFAEKFFDPQNHGALMLLAMELHRENPDTKGIREVQALANEIICQWLLEEYVPISYSDWVKRLRSTMLIKNRYNAKFKPKENPFDEYERRMLNGEYDVKVPDTLPF